MLKYDTSLRCAFIFQNVFGPIFSSSQKTPFILYGGTEVADTYFCIEHLNRVYRVDLNYWLSDEQRAVARAFQMMVEDHLFWWVNIPGTVRCRHNAVSFPHNIYHIVRPPVRQAMMCFCEFKS